MRTCSRCKEEKSVDNFGVDRRRPDGLRNYCRDCARAFNQSFYARNQEQQKQRAKTWREANPEKKKAQSARVPKEIKAARYKSWRDRNLEYAKEKRMAHYHSNRETEIARHACWKAENKDHLAAYGRQRLRDFPEKNRFARSLRRAAEKQATPSWADKKAMLAIYKEAVRLTELTGIPHHVDHIVPLQSPWVCGLHCEANLQILPYYENQSKSNRVWPDMPDLTGCTPLQIAA